MLHSLDDKTLRSFLFFCFESRCEREGERKSKKERKNDIDINFFSSVFSDFFVLFNKSVTAASPQQHRHQQQLPWPFSERPTSTTMKRKTNEWR